MFSGKRQRPAHVNLWVFLLLSRVIVGRTWLETAWPGGCTTRLRAVPGVMPSHTEGRHAYRPAATDCRSLGSASPTVPRSGHRLASAVRSRVGTRGTLGGAGEIPPGASGVRIPAGSARTVDGVS